MRPSQILRSGGGDAPLGKYEKYLGSWGNLGSQKQRGVVSYALSANRQRPLAGTLNAAIFNTFRRFSSQVFYIAPPFLVGYFTMQWAIERNEYLNSKAGIAEFGGGDE